MSCRKMLFAPLCPLQSAYFPIRVDTNTHKHTQSTPLKMIQYLCFLDAVVLAPCCGNGQQQPQSYVQCCLAKSATTDYAPPLPREGARTGWENKSLLNDQQTDTKATQLTQSLQGVEPLVPSR